MERQPPQNLEVASLAEMPLAPGGRIWDRIGMVLSGVCVVHCLALPVVLSLLPVLPFGEALHAWMHPVIAVLLVPTTMLAMATARRRHGDRAVLWLLSAGLFVILVAGVLGHIVPGEWTETLITVAGSALLISGHWRNYRLCSSCTSPGHHHNASARNAEGYASSQFHARRVDRESVGEAR